ncbi:MAG: murein L,D-transpeptidase catalytic domain-containing protein [Ferruginibacter sp.]
MRWLTVFFLTTTCISAVVVLKFFAAGILPNKGAHSINKLSNNKKDENKATLLRLKRYANEAKSYTIGNNLNDRHCFLIDMKKASGSKRFYVYDLKHDSILQAGMVTHGSGVSNSGDTVLFSNRTGGNCSSLGKYKIGQSYYGKFGLAYKLHGLNNTNSNAFNRFVVLHAHPCVPDNEIAPLEICKSWGCPTVSPSFLKELKGYLDRTNTPVLLWIFQ